MHFMVPTLILAALCADPRIDGPGLTEAGREQALDSLASSILLLGDIPEAPDMLILTAWRGWPGRIGYIEIIPADADSGSTGSPPGQSDVWGSAGSGTGGDHVLVVAPRPEIVPVGLPLVSAAGDTVRFRLLPAGCRDTVLVSTPSLGFLVIPPGEDGSYVLVPAERGVFWLEVLRTGTAGPEVVMLLPLLSGVTPAESFSPCPGVHREDAPTLPDVLDQLDSLRMETGLRPLARDPSLDSLARIRAVEVALSGRVDHSGLLCREMPADGQARAENIGSGEGLDEAWRMVLASPAHLGTCLSPLYATTGLGTAVEVTPDGWRMVLVQLFEGEARP
jgi:hypothetical protein